MSEPLAYLNGRLLPFSAATLSLGDLGFTAGATVVDNARTYNGKLFRFADHLARFRRDCAACFVPLLTSDADLTRAAEALVVHNRKSIASSHRANGPDGDLHLVTFATPGLSHAYGSNTGPTLGMVTFPLQVERYRRFFSEGATLAIVGHQPVDASAILSPMWKQRSRMHWHIADHQAPSGTVAVLLDQPDGTLTETSFANVLAVIDGVVVSPPRELILDGISLNVTMELCRSLGLPFAEQPIRQTDIPICSEMLLTGSAFGIAGVRQVDAVEIVWPGPVYHRLAAAWSQVTGVEIGTD